MRRTRHRRDAIRITLTDGTIQLMQRNGVLCWAVYHGNGRLEAVPRILSKRTSFSFLRSKVSSTCFYRRHFFFTDSFEQEIAKQVKWQAAAHKRRY